jgi:hypothetical protein
MACHELGALRLGLMKILGIEDEAAKVHDENELGESLRTPGTISSLTKADNLKAMQSLFQTSLGDLEKKVAEMDKGAKELPYYRSLMILTKKVELNLENQLNSLNKFYEDLDEIHDFVHEVYPE